MHRRALTLALLCLAGLPARGGNEEVRYDDAIARLADPDPEQRRRAQRLLVGWGTPAVAELRAALARIDGRKHRRRIEATIAHIEMSEPHGLRFRATMPRVEVTHARVNEPEFRFGISVRNFSDKTVVLWPYLSLRIRDEQGRPIKPARRLARRGVRAVTCYLENVRFVTIKPGGTWVSSERFDRRRDDHRNLYEWKFPGPGTYTLEFTYHFERAAAKGRCRQDWAPLHDAARPWNTALELDHTFTTRMRVR